MVCGPRPKSTSKSKHVRLEICDLRGVTSDLQSEVEIESNMTHVRFIICDLRSGVEVEIYIEIGTCPIRDFVTNDLHVAICDLRSGVEVDIGVSDL